MHALVVDNEAEYMFPPTMNGCTFAIGSETNTGARLVGHVSISRASGDSAGWQGQQDAQADVARSQLGAPTMLESKDYTPFGSGQLATTFGLRDKATGAWSFYTQVYTRVGSKYTLVQFRKIR